MRAKENEGNKPQGMRNLLLDRPILFYPALARLFGGINEAIIWQQLSYWSDKGRRKDGWIYKTKKEIEKETTLTREMQDRARKYLELNGYLETKVMKVNNKATLHYKVNIDSVLHALSKVSNTPNLESETHVTKEGVEPTFLLTTESTTESTTYIKQSAENVTLPVYGKTWVLRLSEIYSIAFEALYGRENLVETSIPMLGKMLKPLYDRLGEVVVADMIIKYVGLEDWDDGRGRLIMEPYLANAMFPLRMFPGKIDRIHVYMANVLNLEMTKEASRDRVRSWLEEMKIIEPVEKK